MIQKFKKKHQFIKAWKYEYICYCNITSKAACIASTLSLHGTNLQIYIEL